MFTQHVLKASQNALSWDFFIFIAKSYGDVPANSITQITIYGPVNGKYTTTVPATELLLYQSGQK